MHFEVCSNFFILLSVSVSLISFSFVRLFCFIFSSKIPLSCKQTEWKRRIHEKKFQKVRTKNTTLFTMYTLKYKQVFVCFWEGIVFCFFLMQVVWRGFCQRFRRREQRVGKLWRMGQRAGCLGPLAIRHQPAWNCNGHSDKGQKGSNDKGDDESDFRNADFCVRRCWTLRCDLRIGFATFKRQNGVWLHL